MPVRNFRHCAEEKIQNCVLCSDPQVWDLFPSVSEAVKPLVNGAYPSKQVLHAEIQVV